MYLVEKGWSKSVKYGKYEENDESFSDDLTYIYNVNTYRNVSYAHGGVEFDL